MASGLYIGGDWGTSHLRLRLCAGDGRVLDERRGAGVAAVHDGGFAAVFDGLSADWTEEHGALPALLCGMVGSTLGWVDAGYADCPASARQLAARSVSLRAGAIHIIPGLACRNRLNAPDVMRGEETQILGALLDTPSLHEGRQLLCLPGTHTKWALLEDGSTREFITAPTGELYALLCQHSVLVRGADPTGASDAAFDQALAQVRAQPGVDLLHQIFQCRSRSVRGELAAIDAAAFLSGLLIAHDCAGALQLFAQATHGVVHVIGSAQVNARYCRALQALGITAVAIDGDRAVQAGLLHLHRLIA
ncbi:MAG: 2-dehydro-3-deoxygalactonokinase [Steroidobacteraceae bacterium]